MTCFVYFSFILSVHCALHDVSRRTIKDLYRPYGPEMCKDLQGNVIDSFKFLPMKLSCQRIPPACVKNKYMITDISSAPEHTPVSKDMASPGNLLGWNRRTGHTSVQCKAHINLLQACVKGKLEDVKNILHQRLQDINCRGFKGRTPVMVAALRGQKAVFDFLVSQCCDLSLVDIQNNTVFHLACTGGNQEILRVLSDHGTFDIEMPGIHKMTPVMIAARYGHKMVFELLVHKGCNLSVDVDRENLLHMACFGGNVDIVNYLLSKKLFDIESKGPSGWTPVMYSAANNSDLDVVRILEKRGCNMKVVDFENKTILHIACSAGSMEMVKYIISQKVVDIESKEKYGKTPVLIAAFSGHINVVELLAKEGCNLTAVNNVKANILHEACAGNQSGMVQYIVTNSIVDIDSRDNGNRTPVMYAVSCGYRDVAEVLMNRSCNMRAVDKDRCNLLHIAIIGGHIGITKFILLKEMFGLETANEKGLSPVLMAAYYGHVDIADLLKHKGCDLKAVDKSGKNVLHWACTGGNVNMVKYALSQDIYDIESRDYIFNATAVMHAASFGHLEVVKLLLDKGCDWTALDNKGNNMFHWACLENRINVVKYLLTQDLFDPETRGSTGATPVMMAAGRGHLELVRLLLNRGCAVRTTDNFGNNMCHYASTGTSVRMLKFVLSQGICDTDSRGTHNRTLLMMAVKAGRLHIVMLLVNEGCNLRAVDSNGNTVSHVACLHDNVPMVKYLIKMGIMKDTEVNHQGVTPLQIAKSKGCREIVALLTAKM